MSFIDEIKKGGKVGEGKSDQTYFERMLEDSRRVKEKMKGDISFRKPLLELNDTPLVYPKTINVIQGQTGVHKSRLAEEIIAALFCGTSRIGIARGEDENPAIKKDSSDFFVGIIDTERNLDDQLPYALQSICKRAYLDHNELPSNMDILPLSGVSRADRLPAVRKAVQHFKGLCQKGQHLFILLDVITDCISNYNNVDQSMLLIDDLNRLINDNDCTLLCIIHENPGNEGGKARGTIGTELVNKASTVLSISFVKDKMFQDTDLIQMKCKKTRGNKRPPVTHLFYNEDLRGLDLAPDEMIRSNGNAQETDTKDLLLDVLSMTLGNGNPMPKADLFAVIEDATKLKERAIQTNLSAIMQSKIALFNDKGETCFLERTGSTHKVEYALKRVQNEDSETK